MTDQNKKSAKKELPKDKFLGGMYDFPVDEDYELMEEMGQVGPEWRNQMEPTEKDMPEMTKQPFQSTPDISERSRMLLRDAEKLEKLSKYAANESSQIGTSIAEILLEKFYNLCFWKLNLNKDQIDERIDKIRNATSTKEEEESGADEIYAIWGGMIDGINKQLMFATVTGTWSILEINQK